ncbi:MAG TPA: hypothetical protein VH854_14345 [Thermoanaerobaculia bacterium]|jgi:hypothetical protein|nr:hypothetical protein [Thermoanaerobaculia bacterium]
MRVLSARIHGYLDFVVIALLAIGSLAVGLGGTPLLIAWLIAAAHLVLTLATRFPMGIWRVIPFVVHGLIELAVAVFFVSLPFTAGYSPGSPARHFYVVMGALIFLVWVLTDYKREDGLQSAP